MAIFLGVSGYTTTRDAIRDEGITFGAADDPAVAKHADQWAGQQVETGEQARAFAKVMREHTLESTGGLTYAEMGRFQSAAKPDDPAGTSDEAAAAKDESGQPVANGARNIWVTETALTTALNMSYMAEQLSMFGMVVGARAAAHRRRPRDPRVRGLRQARRGCTAARDEGVDRSDGLRDQVGAHRLLPDVREEAATAASSCICGKAAARSVSAPTAARAGGPTVRGVSRIEPGEVCYDQLRGTDDHPRRARHAQRRLGRPVPQVHRPAARHRSGRPVGLGGRADEDRRRRAGRRARRRRVDRPLEPRRGSHHRPLGPQRDELEREPAAGELRREDRGGRRRPREGARGDRRQAARACPRATSSRCT